MYIVEIDDGVWLAPWSGDPGRTLVKESARQYKTLHGAKIALGMAVRKYPWRGIKLTTRIETLLPNHYKGE